MGSALEKEETVAVDMDGATVSTSAVWRWMGMKMQRTPKGHPTVIMWFIPRTMDPIKVTTGKSKYKKRETFIYVMC